MPMLKDGGGRNLPPNIRNALAEANATVRAGELWLDMKEVLLKRFELEALVKKPRDKNAAAVSASSKRGLFGGLRSGGSSPSGSSAGILKKK